MKNVIIIQVISKRKLLRNFYITIASVVLVYLTVAWYFTSHFFFNTTINGASVSLSSYDKAKEKMRTYTKNYQLEIIERDGRLEVISGQDIKLRLNEEVDFTELLKNQKALLWSLNLLQKKTHKINNLFVYSRNMLVERIQQLECLHNTIIEPRSVTFHYVNGSYHVEKEIEGNKIEPTRLNEAIRVCLSQGKKRLNLYDKDCYIVPLYTMDSQKTLETKNILNKYVSSLIIYNFGNKSEKLDGDTIHKWIHVDNNLDISISKTAIKNYAKDLSKKYDTVGITRRFKTSTGKDIDIVAGLYGWRINQEAESREIMSNVKAGIFIEREPIYIQRAISREGNEIGNTYVEINISKQYVWFYKDGKLIVGGPVVTGNPNRGNATVTGVHMLNYKQKDVTLRGAGYEAKVTYWMPFYGNIGMHDASWRNAFGGEIYKRNGSHGCVNAPLYVAKTVYKYIEEGIPVIVYEE